MEKYPYLVIEKDQVVQGYAYAREYIGRAACDWSCEVSIYLARDAVKCGMGRMLYEAMENVLNQTPVFPGREKKLLYPLNKNRSFF